MVKVLAAVIAILFVAILAAPPVSAEAVEPPAKPAPAATAPAQPPAPAQPSAPAKASSFNEVTTFYYGAPVTPYPPAGQWVWEPVRQSWVWVLIVPPPIYYYYPSYWVIEGLPPGKYTYEPNPDFEKSLLSGMFLPPKPPKMVFPPGQGPAFPWAPVAPGTPAPGQQVTVEPPQRPQPAKPPANAPTQSEQPAAPAESPKQ